METRSKAKLEKKLIAELASLEKRGDFLNTRLDELTLAIRDIEHKRRYVSGRKQVVIAELDQLGVKYDEI